MLPESELQGRPQEEPSFAQEEFPNPRSVAEAGNSAEESRPVSGASYSGWAIREGEKPWWNTQE